MNADQPNDADKSKQCQAALEAAFGMWKDRNDLGLAYKAQGSSVSRLD